MKISLCMIIKDEEKYIKQCLDNALPLVDEAIVVDTGSTDNTINIIEDEYKGKVKLINHEWNNDFAEARNKSLEEANGEWILILDADEKINFDKEKLIDELKNTNMNGYNIPMYNFLGPNNIVYSEVMPRLVKNNRPKYIGAIHEQITLNNNPVERLGTLETTICKIIHYGYLHENIVKKNKVERNIKIIMDELKKNPENGFQWYNLGVTYMGQEKYSQAIDAFIKSNKFSSKERLLYHDDLVIRFAKCLYKEKNYKQLKNYLDALQKDKSITKYPDYHYYYGKLFEKKKKYTKAIANFEKAIEKGEIKNSISQKGMGSFIPNIEIARILVKKKKINDAILKYMEAIFDPYNFSKLGKEELEKLLVKEKKSDILSEFRELLKNENNDPNDRLKSLSDINKIKDYKQQIEKSIENGYFDKASKMIEEYEKNIGKDADILSIKAVIAMIEGNINNAENFLLEGYSMDDENFDILYNLAYIYQNQGNIIKAYEFYNKAVEYTQDEHIKKEINDILDGYKKNEEINKPKVSIIIPTYNQKDYLKQAIDSCLAQDYPNLEIIVGDDCSIDGTEKMMRNYTDNNKIRYIKRDVNLGARKNALDLFFNYVNGKYVVIFDHDDYFIKKDYITVAVELLENNKNLSFVWANCIITDENGNKVNETTFNIPKINNGLEYFINYESERYPHITGVLTSVFNYDKIIKSDYGNERTMSGDLFLYLKLMLEGDVGFINEAVAAYRNHKDSISYNMPLEFDRPTLEEFEKLKNYAQDLQIADEKQMEKWINNRVFRYIRWRFVALWDSDRKRDALELLMSISKKYPESYEKILNNI